VFHLVVHGEVRVACKVFLYMEMVTAEIKWLARKHEG
jgi:hypothetical protein